MRIGTRGSKLALAQSEWVRAKVEERYPEGKVELVRIATKGDKIQDSPLSRIGSKGLFVKEIEDALLRKEVDIAVHSMKDLPTDLPDYLHLPIFPEREDPHDAFISIDYQTFGDLPEASSIGTSSLRRSAQLLHLRSDLDVVPLRGNVDTRLRKLESRNLQAIILAVAGLKRLGLSAKISQVFSSDELLPAIGQGALGLELRKDDVKIWELLRFLNHEPTETTLKAERAFLKELGGGCQVPIAAYGHLHGNDLILTGMVAELDGTRVLRDEARGERDSPEDIGIILAGRLLSSGADQILERIHESSEV